MIVYFINLSTITIIKLKVSYIAGSFNSSNLTIMSIIILFYSESRTSIN